MWSCSCWSAVVGGATASDKKSITSLVMTTLIRDVHHFRQLVYYCCQVYHDSSGFRCMGLFLTIYVSMKRLRVFTVDCMDCEAMTRVILCRVALVDGHGRLGLGLELVTVWFCRHSWHSGPHRRDGGA